MNVIKTDHAFRGYAISYKVEFVVKKDPIKQLWKQTDFSNYVSDQEFENSMDLLLAIDENKSHYVYVKDFDRFMFHKTENKNKKYFCKSCLQCFISKNVSQNIKKFVWALMVQQSARLEKQTIEFKNYFRQIPVSFKI